ncbi:hypothetical protein FGG08_004641 [Glutinoglossum americanum]|uniref:Uncharacterized protein n=1 Tax=Glutinoglossum americanum TaxID=1670608 RepID=A0A9P8I8U8_9PEZI|nr:hypothetical protein FGG08_004641 [Glutinoglossum americanum]
MAGQSPLPAHLDPPPPSETPYKPHPRIKDIKLLLEVAALSCQGARDFLGTVNASNMVEEAVSCVFRWLYATGSTIPGTRSVTLILRSMDGVAYTTGKDLDDDHKEIHFSTDYIANISSERKKDEILGVICHEMVHCFQFDGCHSAPSGLIEGIADWVRLCSGLKPPHWKRSAEGGWDGGYDRTGYFLEYLEQRFGEGSVRKINENLRNKYQEESFWKGLFGHHVAELWEDYGRQLKGGGIMDETALMERKKSPEGSIGDSAPSESVKTNGTGTGKVMAISNMADEENTQLPTDISTATVGVDVPKMPDINGDQNEEASDIKSKSKPKPKPRPKPRKTVTETEEAGDDKILANGEAADTASTPTNSPQAPKTPKAPKGKRSTNDSKAEASAKKRTPKSAIKASDETNLTPESIKIVTPRKKRAPTGVPKDANGEPSTPPNKKRRTPAATPTLARSIPESRDELDEKDKILLDLKNQGKTWPEIREEFKKMGIPTGTSTLPNRYSRLTAKLTEWKAGDVDIFLAAKSTIETEHLEEMKAKDAKFETEKWGKISAAMEEKGTNRYPPGALQKKFKDVTARGLLGALGSTNNGPSNISDSTGPMKATSGTLITEAAEGQRSGSSEGM